MKKSFMLFLFFFILLLTSNSFAEKVFNESEVGITASQGNARAQNYNFKQLNSYHFEQNLLRLSARYLNAFSNGIESARYLNGNLRYERELSSLFSLFLAEGYESDRFAGYKERWSSDLGSKYYAYKEEKTIWLVEAGYRYMKENRRDGSNVGSNYLRGYTELENKWNQQCSTKLWVEYLPNLTTSEDYQINSEASVSLMMSEILSMKTGYLVRYDNLPAPGIHYRTDSLFTTALVAKF